jgi:hypothetical protein
VDPNIFSFITILNINYNTGDCLNLGEIFERYNIIYYIILRLIKIATRE